MNADVKSGRTPADEVPSGAVPIARAEFPTAPLGGVRILLAAWSAYMHRAGRYQSIAVLNVVYFTIFGPSVLAARLFGAKVLDVDTRSRASYWTERKSTYATLEELARQF